MSTETNTNDNKTKHFQNKENNLTSKPALKTIYNETELNKTNARP